mmetsp:Transcript_16005/g.32815  ORF Transcript_16005/g.32815 Transcript_16005/m.32815 type:complete len:225 (+) Transcript_16005:221-895(+)
MRHFLCNTLGIPRAPDGDASVVGEPRHRRASRHGSWFQPALSQFDERKTEAFERTHHDKVAPHSVHANGSLRGRSNHRCLCPALPAARDLPEAALELVKLWESLDATVVRLDVGGGALDESVLGFVPRRRQNAATDVVTDDPGVHGNAQSLVGGVRERFAPQGCPMAEQVVAGWCHRSFFVAPFGFVQFFVGTRGIRQSLWNGTTNGRRLEDRVVVVESDFAGG